MEDEEFCIYFFCLGILNQVFVIMELSIGTLCGQDY